MPWEILSQKRNDGRIIIHFDYDCFYAATFEREDPHLRHLPLAVQQKQIIVTCNYEARRKGLRKLQLVKEARKQCPEVIVVLGEDLTRFRNASKELYAFLRAFAWSDKVEKLGFDEVFMDVTDMVDYNMELLNRNDRSASFFHLDRNDPLVGFAFDASYVAGHVFPTPTENAVSSPGCVSALPKHDDSSGLYLRLLLGSHLALYLRHQLEEQKGYSSTVGVSTNKLISKLVGNLHKPQGQTTLMPPYTSSEDQIESSVTKFIDDHGIGKIPGIGFKLAQKIRGHILGQPAVVGAGLIHGPAKDVISVKEVRLRAGMGPDLLDKILSGPGAPKGIGQRIWGLINGIDDSEVLKAKAVPQQISIEDSYTKLNVMGDVEKELLMLVKSLIRRMRVDLMSTIIETDDFDLDIEQDSLQNKEYMVDKQWIAHPRTLRLTTRQRSPLKPDGTRLRIMSRISKSCAMPSLIFNKTHSIEFTAESIVHETLLPLFRKLHPEQSEWNLNLVNICASNMSLIATGNKDGAGRHIGRMFKQQKGALRDWKVADVDVAPSYNDSGLQQSKEMVHAKGESEEAADKPLDDYYHGSEDKHISTQESFFEDILWDIDPAAPDAGEACRTCGAVMPAFAITAHERFHAMLD